MGMPEVNSTLPSSIGIEHLAKTVWCSPFWREVRFPMFTTCFDGSGKERDHHYLVVAGFLSSANDWIEFSRLWEERLQQDCITCFHATDFRTSHGEFESWRNQESRRRKLLGDLVDLIKSHAYRQFGCVVEFTYKDCLSPEMLNRFAINAYTLAARTCFRDVEWWARAERTCSPIEYVFEDGDVGKGLLIERLERDGFQTPAFKYKKDTWKKGIFNPKFVPLQACDLWAYEIFQAVKTQSEERWAYQELKRIPGEVKTWDIEDLQNLQEHLQVIANLDDWTSKHFAKWKPKKK